MKTYPIFDIHTHTYPERIAEKACTNLGAFYEFIVEGKGTYADLEASARPYQVKGFLLFSVATNPIQVPKVNDSIASLVELSRSHGFETVGFAGMHQDYPDFTGEIDRVEKMGLRGIKIHPDIQEVDIDDPRMLRLYEIVEGRMPVYFHIGDWRPQYRFSEAKKLCKVLDMFPRLEVVAAHLGGHRAFEEAKMLAGRPNVWYDTSSALWAMTPEYAHNLIHRLGTDRVMFGTDYPVKLHGEEIERLLAVGLEEHELEDIFYNNAKRFLKL